MYIKRRLLLALASVVALFVAASVASQERRPDVIYPLEIQCTADEVFVGKGVAGLPVALVFGFEERMIALPGNAFLRVEPVVFAIAGKFDIHGQFSLPIKLEAADPGDFLMQALSFEFDFGKLCTTQLVGVHVASVDELIFSYLD